MKGVCPECETMHPADEDCPAERMFESCSVCLGTGIGQYGDPDTSKCWGCHGRGYIIPAPDLDPDRAYDEARDREIERQ